MANYSYSSYSTGGGYGAADAAFNVADVNQDGQVDLGEFRSFLGQNGVAGTTYESAYNAAYGLGGAYGASAALGGVYDAGYGAGYGNTYQTSYGVGNAGLAGAAYNTVVANNQVQQYATDAQGLYVDSNPTVIRRPAAQGVQTYLQNIRVKFLQPPPVPPHGPLIIKEVRPPQPPAPAPLRIRQQAPPLPVPPPLVLRERPPQPPAVIAGQTVIRRLAALPVPPRSVVIERLPPLPPKPRDVIIERWVPYGAQAKRRTIVQRAGPAVQYAAPKNVIIQYEPVQVRVLRQFQNLGVAPGSPAAYVQQYGGTLLNSGSLVAQARAAGVVEDLTPPGLVGPAYGYGAGTYGLENYVSGGYGNVVYNDAALGGVYNSSLYENYDAGYGLGAGYSTSAYDYTTGAGYGGVYGGGLYGNLYGAANAAFNVADSNQDGVLNYNEFTNFVGNNLVGATYY